MPKKLHKRSCDPSWRMCCALGHKVESNPKGYTRKWKHPPKLDNDPVH